MSALSNGKAKLANVISFDNLPKDRNANLWMEIRTECRLSLDELSALQNVVCSSGQEKRIINVKVNEDKTFLLGVSCSSSWLDEIKTKLRENGLAGKKRGRSVGVTDEFVFHKLYDAHNIIVGDADTLINNQTYFFRIPNTLEPKSASLWKEKELTELKINFTHSKSIFRENLLNEESLSLIEELKPLNRDIFKIYNKLSVEDERDTGEESKYLQNLIIKATFMVIKYLNHESVVNCFILLLLKRIGFFKNWLYVLPEFRLPLKFGETIEEAIPDFTVVDFLSFPKMAVVKDKRYEGELLDSEPQLIAELIALFQTNDESASAENIEGKGAPIVGKEYKDSWKELPIIGVRVNGLKFWFYHIENPEHLLAAIDLSMSASEVTNVKKAGGGMGLDFLYYEDRLIIINTLSTCCCQFSDKGLSTKRHMSHSPAPQKEI